MSFPGGWLKHRHSSPLLSKRKEQLWLGWAEPVRSQDATPSVAREKEAGVVAQACDPSNPGG